MSGRHVSHLQLAAVAVIVTVVAGYLLNQYQEGATAAALDASLVRAAEESAHRLEVRLSDAIETVRFLAQVPPVLGLVRAVDGAGFDAQENTDTAGWQRRLAQIFRARLDTRGDFFQLRYIGVADGGRELVRVERVAGRARIASGAELQKKGTRSYFARAAKARRGEVFVSALEPNMENGVYDIPVRPTLRVVAPVHDENGAFFGAIVANVDAHHLFSVVRLELPAGFSLFALNGDGDFVAHPNAERLFGSRFSKRWRRADEFPEAGSRASGPARADGARVGSQVLRPHPLAVEEVEIAVSASPAVLAGLRANAREGTLPILALGGLGLFLVLLAGRWGLGRRTELRREQLHRAAIVEGSRDAIVGLSVAGHVTSWNSAATLLTGISETAALGLDFYELVGFGKGLHLEAMTSGVVVSRQAEFSRADGEKLVFDVTLSPIVADGESLAGASAVVRDVTEAQQLRFALERANERLEAEVAAQTTELRAAAASQAAVVAGIGHAVVAARNDGTITVFNEAAERPTGLLSRDVVGVRNVLDLFDSAGLLEACGTQSDAPATLPRTVACLEAAAGDAVFHWSTADGRAVPVSIRLRRVASEEDGALGLVLIAVDLGETLRRQAELEAARRSAEESERAKAEFLANMSHEIRTPMNAVLGMLQLLSRSPMGPAQTTWTRMASTSADALMDVLNDILDYSKLQAGKLAVVHEPFRPDRLFREVGAVLSASLGPKPLDLVFDVERGLPRQVMGDPMRLKQVLLNLAGNAVKFTEEGQVIISVRGGQRRDTWRFSVVDTGIGMSAEQVDRVFQGFEQGDAGTSRQYGGTGLGLAISSQLVGLMGGELTVSSRPGAGSTFTFDCVLPEVEDVVASRHGGQGGAPGLRGLRVLQIERSDVARRALAESGAQYGWCVQSFESGAQALASLLHDGAEPASSDPNSFDLTSFDLTILDWRAADGSLARFVEELTTRARVVAGPIVVLTTAHGQELLLGEGAASSEPMTFLVRPVTNSQLLEAASEALSDSEGASVDNRNSTARLHTPMRPDARPSAAGEVLLDTGAALRRLSNNRKVLGDAMATFVQEYAGRTARWRELWKRQELETLRREAHTLRGAAATLGATALHSVLLALEAQLRGNHVSDLSSAFDEVEPVLNSTVDIMRGTQVTGGQSSAQPSLSRRTDALSPKVLAELRRALVNANMAAIDLYERHREQIELLEPEQGLSLGRALQRFDFDAAVAACDRVSRRLMQ